MQDLMVSCKKSHTHPKNYFIRMRLVLVIVSCVEGTQKRRLCFRLDSPVILSH